MDCISSTDLSERILKLYINQKMEKRRPAKNSEMDLMPIFFAVEIICAGFLEKYKEKIRNLKILYIVRDYIV